MSNIQIHNSQDIDTDKACHRYVREYVPVIGRAAGRRGRSPATRRPTPAQAAHSACASARADR